jgi:hypothetical protein
MIGNLRRVFYVSLLLAASRTALSQGAYPLSGQGSNVAGSGVVTGVVKLGEVPASGITLALLPDRMGPMAQGQDITNRAVTDDKGEYRFTNVVAGRFRVTPLAEAFVITSGATSLGGQGGIAVTVSEGQTVSDIDFTLARGGVITGRVTDGDGRPVIAENLNLTLMDANGQPRPFNAGNRFGYETDDRGVYRIYGLPAGRYLVSAGGSDRPGMSRRIRYPLTYYPDAVEQEQAKAVEVQTDFVAEEIDIKLGEPVKTYAVAGRVVDADSGQPAPGLPVNIAPQRGAGRGAVGAAAGSIGAADGSFRVTGLTPGSYYASAGSSNIPGAASTDFYSDPVVFEISGANVTGLEIKVHQGASIAGVVVIDGGNDPNGSSAIAAQLSQLMISASSRGGQQSQGQAGRGGMGGQPNFAQVAADGSFRIGGLPPGQVRLSVNSPGFGRGNGFALERIERNGAVINGGFNVASGEQVTGVRVVVAYGAGVIQGRVVVTGGTLPPGTRLMVSVRPLNSDGRNRPAQVDASGQFRVEGLLPGSYELRLNAMAFTTGGSGAGRGGRGAGRGTGAGAGVGGGRGGGFNGSRINIPDVRQTVSVTNGSPSNVTLDLNLSQQ